jgi:N-methylhydantoinase A
VFADRLASALGADPVVAAHAVSEVVNENMAAAARAHLAEWGKGTAGRQMIAFGGAAPLHACLLAHKLKLDSVVVPANAGVGSAVGFLLAPVSYEVVRSRYTRLDELDRQEVEQLMAEMRAEALDVVAEAADPETLEETRKAFMRYVGQGYEIAVPVAADVLPDPRALRDDFESEYRRLYGRTIPGLEVEVLSWTLALGERQRDARQHDGWALERERSAGARRDVFDVVLGTRVQAGCYERARLEPGDYLRGPALVAEEQTTTFVASGYRAVVSRRRHLILVREEA